MSDTITLTGLVATTPRSTTTQGGLEILSFRLASPQRKRTSSGEWEDAGTNWYTVTAFRRLASNCAASLNQKDRVIVSGRVEIKTWEKDGKEGTTVEIIAESIGHDLFWGTSSFTKGSADTSPVDNSTPAADPWASAPGNSWDGGPF